MTDNKWYKALICAQESIEFRMDVLRQLAAFDGGVLYFNSCLFDEMQEMSFDEVTEEYARLEEQLSLIIELGKEYLD